MLTEHELDQLCKKLGLSTEARRVIDNVRSSPPTRRVRSTAGNVSVQFKSRKMGCTIQAESHKVELAGVYEKEFDESILEFWDQPPRIKLVYEAKSGRNTGVWSTPDYFVIRKDGVGWEEWKTEESLLKLAEEMPNRYVKDGNVWRCLPGDEHAAKFGFSFWVRSSAEINWVLQSNLRFLADYHVVKKESLDKDMVYDIKSLVAEKPGITLDELLETEKASPDLVYTLIAQEQIYINLQSAKLIEPERVIIFRDHETAKGYTTTTKVISKNNPSPFVTVKVGSSVNWDGQSWRIINVGDTETTLLSDDGTHNNIPQETFSDLIRLGQISNPKDTAHAAMHPIANDLLAKASPSDFAIANERYVIIRPYLDGNPPNSEIIPKRTIRNYISKWKKAEAAYGCGYVGLLPQYHASGNRQPKLPANVKDQMNEFILNNYETLKQKSISAVYGELVKKCEELSIVAPCYKTFAKAIHMRPQHDQTEKRKGRRAAYQEQEFYHELTMTTPRHGDRPFEIGHIDHTELDIELVDSSTGRNLGRPWLTILMDAYSRRFLALTISFDPPSYRSSMATLRECVMQHSRLPESIVVDGGRDFQGVYFETLLARYEIHKKSRKTASARDGSVCERLFGTTNTRFIHNLVGNTQITRNVRQVTKSVNPKNQAVWTLPELDARLREWAYEVYDTIEHPALSQSPRDAFLTGMKRCGNRPHKLIPYDESFCMLTLPTTRKETAKVSSQLGVKINHIYYWSEAFREPEISGTQVPVRYDPFDAGIAYAYVSGHWVRCISEHHSIFEGRSEREIQIATAILRKQHRLRNQEFKFTVRKLANFITSIEAEELLLIQRSQDDEYKKILTPSDEPVLQQEKAPDERQGSKTARIDELSVQESEATVENLDIYPSFEKWQPRPNSLHNY